MSNNLAPPELFLCICCKRQVTEDQINGHEELCNNCLDNIRNGRWCPYCFRSAVLINSKQFYRGRNYGMVWACLPCKAWVGARGKEHVPLGRLANAELRKAKSEAHKYFDIIWKIRKLTRTEAYTRLAIHLGLPLGVTHIGQFDDAQCQMTISFAKEFLNVCRQIDINNGKKPKTARFTI